MTKIGIDRHVTTQTDTKHLEREGEKREKTELKEDNLR